MPRPLHKSIIVYALALVLLTGLLEWIEYRFLLRRLSGGWAVALVAVIFIVLGIWVGTRIVRRAPPPDFTVNRAALDTLGVSPREHRVLELLAEGQTNKEIARTLSISPNTVKTHVANLFAKLDVSRRTEAINKSRQLRLIP